MLKFVKEHMQTIEGVATYPMISLLIFFVFLACYFGGYLRRVKNILKKWGSCL